MAINSRTKGAAAEREVSRLLFDELGIRTARNLEQSRSGGYDLLPDKGSLLEPYAIEIKRYAKVSNAMLKVFWNQAVEQAERANKSPVLLYREDRAAWLGIVSLSLINNSLSQSNHFDNTAIVTLPGLCGLVREIGGAA
jgi:Holliday junction resolvase